MSRSSGSYTAPAGTWNPAVSGTAVDETDWNILLADIEAALTESVYTSGLGSTDNLLARTDGIDQKKLQGSTVTLSDAGVLAPTLNDGGALGSNSLSWSDLFLASGGVINWNNGGITITDAGVADQLYFGGAANGYFFSANVGPLSNDGATLGVPNTNMWSDLFLASGGVINWNNGDVTITHSADNIAVGGGNLLVGYTTSNGSFLLQVNSQIFATNATISTSDGRFKTNVAPIEDATEIVKALRPVAYDWKPHDVHKFARERQAGFIAQEVREAVAGTDWGASLVQENEQAGEPFLGLAETKLLPVVVQALQEALTRIETLEARLAEVAR